MEYKDYYKILGIDKKASQDEVKKAYRKLAVKYHPDKNPGDKKSEEKFKEINEANDVLGDVAKRKKYDDLGDNWQQYATQNNNQGYASSNGKRRTKQQSYRGGDFGGEGNFSDFFESIFGYGENRQSSRQMRGEDYQAETTITLEEAFNGTTRLLTLAAQKLNLKLKPGITDGQVLKMKDKGGPGFNGAANGDLYITVHIAQHHKYKVKGKDLYADEPLDVYTAIIGGKEQVQAIDKTVSITIPPGTDSDKTFRLKGMGMPDYTDPTRRGDYYARMVITVPKNLTTEEKKLIEELAGKRKA